MGTRPVAAAAQRKICYQDLLSSARRAPARLRAGRQQVEDNSPQPDAHTRSRQDVMLERARQLYEVAWSAPRGVLVLDTIMAQDHRQVDVVWQAGRPGPPGRRIMKRGILAYRAAYPDIRFVVQSIAAVPGRDEVFVHWTAAGTNTGPIRDQPPSGQRVEFAGVSVLRFNADTEIQESMVFRQAPEDEKRYFTGRT